MGNLAFVFSGQGAQYGGMGRDLYNHYEAAREIFALAESLRPGTREQCFCGGREELTRTENTQPCIFCVSLAAAYCLQNQGIRPDFLAGFSMGEITALTFAGVFSVDEGFKLICRRAWLMQKAAEKQPGKMVAVLKLPAEEVERLCQQFTDVYPVNYNCPGQTVVALAESKLPEFSQTVKAAGGKALPIAVGGGFHSPFMAEAGEELLKALAGLKLKQPELPVFANNTARPYYAEEQLIKETIAAQVVQPVLWQKSIENMVAAGTDTFIEVGPGNVLTNLIKKISPEAVAFSVEDQAGLRLVTEYLSNRT